MGFRVTAEVEFQVQAIPIVSIVVPFGDYLTGPYIYIYIYIFV